MKDLSNYIPINLKNGLNKYSDYEGKKLTIFIRKQVNLLNDDNPDIQSFQFKSIYFNIVQNNAVGNGDDDSVTRIIQENIWVDFEKTIIFQFDDTTFSIDYNDIISVKNKDKVVMLIQLQRIPDNIKSLVHDSEFPNRSQSLYICFETTKTKSKLLETVINKVNDNVLKAVTGTKSKYSIPFSKLFIGSQVESLHDVDYDIQELDFPLCQPDSPQTSLTASKSPTDQPDSPKTFPQDYANGDKFDSGLSSKTSTPSLKSKKSLLKSQIISKKIVPKKANMQLGSVSLQQDDSDSISKSPTTRSSTKKLNMAIKTIKPKVTKAKQEPKLSILTKSSSSAIEKNVSLNRLNKSSSSKDNVAITTTASRFDDSTAASMNQPSTPPKRRSYKAEKSTKDKIKDTSIVPTLFKPDNKFKPKMRSSLIVTSKRNDYLSDDDIQVTGETPEKVVEASVITSNVSLKPGFVETSKTSITNQITDSVIDKANDTELAYAPDNDYYGLEDIEEVQMKPNKEDEQILDDTHRNVDSSRGGVIASNKDPIMRTSSLLQKASGGKVQISDEARRKSNSFLLAACRDERTDEDSVWGDKRKASSVTMVTNTTTKTPDVVNVNSDSRKNKQRGQQLAIETKKKVEVSSTIETPSHVYNDLNDDYEKLFARPKMPRTVIANTITPKSINAKSVFAPTIPAVSRNKKFKQSSPSTDDVSSDYSISDSELDSDDDIIQQRYEIIAQFNQMRKDKLYKKARKEMDDIEAVAIEQIGSYLLQWIGKIYFDFYTENVLNYYYYRQKSSRIVNWN